MMMITAMVVMAMAALMMQHAASRVDRAPGCFPEWRKMVVRSPFVHTCESQTGGQGVVVLNVTRNGGGQVDRR